MAAVEIDRAVLRDQTGGEVVGELRQRLPEALVQVQADKTFQVLEIAGGRTISHQHLLDRAANIFGGVQQRAVDVEQVDREGRDLSVIYPDHAGCGRSPSLNPGARRPASGRSTCWVWSSESREPELGIGGNCWPLMIAITSLPSRISRSSSASAIFTKTSERSSRMCAAVSYPPCTSFFTCSSMRMAVSSL